eukprot:COSAG02_NODE_56137_length_287_cov_0.569149_1_plen_38_part_10
MIVRHPRALLAVSDVVVLPMKHIADSAHGIQHSNLHAR